MGGNTPETTPRSSVYPNPSLSKKSSQDNHGYALIKPLMDDKALMNATGNVQTTINPAVMAYEAAILNLASYGLSDKFFQTTFCGACSIYRSAIR